MACDILVSSKTLLKIFPDYLMAENGASTPANIYGSRARLTFTDVTPNNFDLSGQTGKSLFIEVDKQGTSDPSEYEITYAMFDAASSIIASVTPLEIFNAICNRTGPIKDDKHMKNYSGRFEIDILRCVFCGFCVFL